MRTSHERRRRRSSVLTLALIGAGRFGANIRRTLNQLPRCHLKYVETREWRKLLRRSDLDGVLIATTASTHAEIARPFIERGIATFIEKPLTTNLKDAGGLERAARQIGGQVFVGHIHLYNPAYDAAKRAIRRAGPIRYLFGEGMNNGPFRDDVSALWDWAPHDLALTLDLLGAMPTSVQAWGMSVLRPRSRLHDLAQLHLAFPNNVQGIYAYSWLAPEKRKRLTVAGTRDTVVFDDTAERKVTVYRGIGPLVRSRRVTRQEPEVTFPPYTKELPLTRELRAFLTMIRTKKLPRADLAQGVAIVRILDVAERSLAASGRPFTL